jgi:hypothetical protein
MAGACGECTACCKVYSIPEFKKPAGPWCSHCAIGVGCKIYEERPERCREYQCLWLESQGRADPRERLDPALRPDRCKVVFAATSNPHVISATLMRGGAHRQKLVASLIKMITLGGGGVAVGAPGAMTTTLITANGEKQVEMSEPDEDGVQWATNND